MWPLRGHALPLDELTPRLLGRIRGVSYAAIIFDPIYKIITGDENSARDMGAFCNFFDRVCSETGASTIYCHHHSKGAQGGKAAMDRAAGSGVFARDPDAQLDIVELTGIQSSTEADAQGVLRWDSEIDMTDGLRGFRLEATLREFEPMEPLHFWFRHPVHELDETGKLAKAFAAGDPAGNLRQSAKRQAGEERQRAIEQAFKDCRAQGISELRMKEFMDIICKYLPDDIDMPNDANGQRTIKQIIQKHPEWGRHEVRRNEHNNKIGYIVVNMSDNMDNSDNANFADYNEDTDEDIMS